MWRLVFALYRTGHQGFPPDYESIHTIYPILFLHRAKRILMINNTNIIKSIFIKSAWKKGLILYLWGLRWKTKEHFYALQLHSAVMLFFLVLQRLICNLTLHRRTNSHDGVALLKLMEWSVLILDSMEQYWFLVLHLVCSNNRSNICYYINWSWHSQLASTTPISQIQML